MSIFTEAWRALLDAFDAIYHCFRLGRLEKRWAWAGCYVAFDLVRTLLITRSKFVRATVCYQILCIFQTRLCARLEARFISRASLTTEAAEIFSITV
jgi:hypothetical protein